MGHYNDALLTAAVAVGLILAAIAIVVIGSRIAAIYVRDRINEALKRPYDVSSQPSLEGESYARTAEGARTASTKEPSSSAPREAYEARFPSVKLHIPKDYERATRQAVQAAITAQETYLLRQAQAVVARKKLMEERHAQGDHSACDTSCPVIMKSEGDRWVQILDEKVHLGDIHDNDLAELAEKIQFEMQRRRSDDSIEQALVSTNPEGGS